LKLRKSRRLLLIALLLMPLVAAQPARAQVFNVVQLENMMAGTTAWQLGGPGADDVNNQIKGYASATSVAQGSSISFYVTVNPAQTFTMDFYRIGWYQGLGGRWLAGSGPLAGRGQNACVPNAMTGLIDCQWAPSYTLSVPYTWTSGIFLVRLISASGYENYIDFVVRDGRPADLLYQQPVNTYQAYNNYPDDNLTGKSLYEYNSFGANTIAGTTRAVKVSYDRPYADSGVGDFLNWEIDFVRWIEGSGYDVTYSTDVDTHENGLALRMSRGFLSVGHDEYWSMPMRNAVEGARDAGVNLGFFGANDDFWQVRLESAANGVADRTIVCYKDASIDPIQGPTTTVNWRSAPVNRPEQTMLGIQFTAMVYWGNNVPYVVNNSWHPVYSNTGFADGDSVAGLVGYEMDRYMVEYPAPVGSGYTLLSHSPFVDYQGFADYGNSSIYRAPSGAWVFTSGTFSWAYGLDSYTGTGADWRIQQTTTNLMDTFAGLVVGFGVLAPATTPSVRVASPNTPKGKLPVRPTNPTVP
jgi:N,N-dimethylformamidase beta subunit-like protein